MLAEVLPHTPKIELVRKPEAPASWGSQSTPYSQEAEEATIGAVQVNPAAYHKISAFLKADDFFILRHKYIWQAFDRLSKAGTPIDYLTLINDLKAAGTLSEIGGAAYLTKLINATPTSVHAEVYAGIVEQAAQRRKLMSAADQIKQFALLETMPIGQVLQEAHAKLIQATGTAYMSSIVPASDLLSDYCNEVDNRVNTFGQTKAFGIPTFIKPLDERIYGLPRGELILLAAVNGMGKTTFALNVALNAIKHHQRVAIFGREMGRMRLMNMIISIESGVQQGQILSGGMTQQERERFNEAAVRLQEPFKYLHLWEAPLDPEWQFSPKYLALQCQMLLAQRGMDLMIVDHLHVMDSDVPRQDDPAKYKYIMRSMFSLARRINAPILQLCQISPNKLRNRAEKNPMKGDCDYNVEPEADIVLGLHRPRVFDPTAPVDAGEIYVTKNRDGGWEGRINVSCVRNKFLEA